jgi:putative heme transporter
VHGMERSPSSTRDSAERVPVALRVAAAWSWRLLLIGAAIVAAAYVAAELRLVVIPAVLAFFLTIVLDPLHRRLRRAGLSRGLAAIASLLAFLGVLAGLFALLVPPVVDELGTLGDSLEDGARQVLDWLAEGPLNVSDAQIQGALDDAVARARDNAGAIGSGVLTGASLVGEIAVGLLLTMVLSFFLLRDGDRLWAWLLDRAGAERREDVERRGRLVRARLGAYLRGVTLVALFDAVFIGLALVVIGVPFALPLAVLTFITAYVPIVGATVAGAAATLVALVAGGVEDALLVLAAVVVVQQVESQLLSPVVVGRAVRLHPAVVLLAVTAGAIVYGVVGAALAAPLAAAVQAVVAEPDAAAEEQPPAAGASPAEGEAE